MTTTEELIRILEGDDEVESLEYIEEFRSDGEVSTHLNFFVSCTLFSRYRYK